MNFVVAGSTLRMQIAIDKTALRDHRDKDNGPVNKPRLLKRA